jgi:hypothetical protein
MNKEPKNAMECEGCAGCIYREDPSGKGWCAFWKIRMRDTMPCWRFKHI